MFQGSNVLIVVKKIMKFGSTTHVIVGKVILEIKMEFAIHHVEKMKFDLEHIVFVKQDILKEFMVLAFQ